MKNLGTSLCALSLFAATLSAGTIPRPAPGFSINMVGGQPIAVSQYAGKVLVVAFILTTCPHCQRTVGILSKLQTEYGPRGLQVLASAIEDGSAANVPDFLHHFQPAFPVGYNSHEDARSFLQIPPMILMHMPELAFVDRTGQIRAQYAGDDTFLSDEANQEKSLRAKIESLLKEAAPARKPLPAPARRKAS